MGSGPDDRRRVRRIAYRSQDRRNEVIPTHSLSRMPDITAHDYSPPRRADIGIREKRRPTSWQAALNVVNASLASSFAGYSSAVSSGNNTVGDSPSSGYRVRDGSLTRPSSTRSFFILLNDFRRSRHNVGSASLRHSEDIESLLSMGQRNSTAEDNVLGALKICATDDTCQSRCLEQTSMPKTVIPGSGGKNLT